MSGAESGAAVAAPGRAGSAPRRKRGGQPGNTNALRHGFYCRKFRQIDLDDLDRIAQGLEGEIAALRVAARRLVDAVAEHGDDLDVEVLGALVNRMGTAFMQVANLMQAHARLTGGKGPLEATLMQALSEIQEKFGL